MLKSRLSNNFGALFHQSEIFPRFTPTAAAKRRCSSRLAPKIDVDKIPPKISVSAALKKLADRFLLSATFPDVLINDLKAFDAIPPIAYCGFDPSSDSLHVGNLCVLNNMLSLYASGFDLIVLIGGATCKLGDPSGRTAAALDRPPIDWELVKKNSESIAKQLELILTNFTKYFLKGSKNRLKPVRFVNNALWYQNLNVIDFLDTYGRLFRVKHFLEKQTVKTRLAESGMNLNEFLYQLFQAYDFLRLYEQYGCLLQIGGTDQIGNVHSGHDLIKKLHDKDAYGIFAPLLTTTDGEKLGKSAGNSVSLDKTVTSPFHLYQHMFRLHDTLMQKYLYLLTFLPVEEIDRLCERHMKNPEERLAQKKLAEQVTLLVHGEDGLTSARRATQVLYDNKIEELLRMTPQEIDSALKDLPRVRLNFRPDFNALELVLATGQFKNEQEAQFWLQRGSVYINGIKVTDPECIMVRDCHVLKNGLTLMKLGKKNHFLVRWSDI